MDKKELLIKVATKLFSEKGFENTSLSEVCIQANVSKGLISHHFKSKNGLLREIFSNTTKLIKEISAPPKGDLPAKEVLIQLIKSFFIQLEEDKMQFQFSLNIMMQPNSRAILSDLIAERATLILEMVTSIFNKINPKESLAMSYMFIAELDGIALNYMVSFKEYPLHKIELQLLKKYQNI